MSQRVFLTGLSSFTGAHIARAFVNAGFDVYATLGKTRKDYDSLQKSRIEFSKVTNFVENAVFGSEKFLEFLKVQPIDVFVNHGAAIKNYRSPDFDYLESIKASTHNISAVFVALKNAGCARVLHSGSFFESEEGWGSEEKASRESFPAMSIYGVSKTLTWELLRFHCEQREIPATKILIPNPIGVYENIDRLAPIFLKLWKENKVPELRTPTHLRDNLPAEWLAKVYVEEASVGPQNSELRFRRPSGFVLTQKDFVEALAKKVRERFAYPCLYDIKPTPSAEQAYRSNSEPVPELKNQQACELFWEQWLTYLSQVA